MTRVRAALAPWTNEAAGLIALLRDEHLAVHNSIDTELAILRVPQSGAWERRRADLCTLAGDVIGPGEVARAGASLADRRYLAAFGPASAGDVATFIGMNSPRSGRW